MNEAIPGRHMVAGALEHLVGEVELRSLAHAPWSWGESTIRLAPRATMSGSETTRPQVLKPIRRVPLAWRVPLKTLRPSRIVALTLWPDMLSLAGRRTRVFSLESVSTPLSRSDTECH